MASKSGSKPSSPRSFPRMGNTSLLQNYVMMKVMLKTMWGEKKSLMLLSWSVLSVGGRVVRQGKWEGSEVARWGRWELIEVGRWGRWEGSEVARWGRWEGSEVARWNSGRMVKHKRGRYLVLFKGGAHKMSPRFHLFVSDVKGTKGWDEFKIFLRGRRDGKALLRSFTSC